MCLFVGSLSSFGAAVYIRELVIGQLLGLHLVLLGMVDAGTKVGH